MFFYNYLIRSQLPGSTVQTLFKRNNAAILFLGLLICSCISEILLIWLTTTNDHHHERESQREYTFNDEASGVLWKRKLLHFVYNLNRTGSTILLAVYVYHTLSKPLFRRYYVPLPSLIDTLSNERDSYLAIAHFQYHVERAFERDLNDGRGEFDTFQQHLLIVLKRSSSSIDVDSQKAIEHVLNYVFSYRPKDVFPTILLNGLLTMMEQPPSPQRSMIPTTTKTHQRMNYFGRFQHLQQSMSLLNGRLSALLTQEREKNVPVHQFYNRTLIDMMGGDGESQQSQQSFLGQLLEATCTAVLMDGGDSKSDDVTSSSSDSSESTAADTASLYAAARIKSSQLPPLHQLIICGTNVFTFSHYFILLSEVARTQPHQFVMQREESTGNSPLHTAFQLLPYHVNEPKPAMMDRSQFIRRMQDITNLVKIIEGTSRRGHNSNNNNNEPNSNHERSNQSSMFQQCLQMTNHKGESPIHSMLIFIARTIQHVKKIDDKLRDAVVMAVIGNHSTDKRTDFCFDSIVNNGFTSSCDMIHPPTGLVPFMLIARLCDNKDRRKHCENDKVFVSITFHLLRRFVAFHNINELGEHQYDSLSSAQQ